jgi:hypothetical protein
VEIASRPAPPASSPAPASVPAFGSDSSVPWTPPTSPAAPPTRTY